MLESCRFSAGVHTQSWDQAAKDRQRSVKTLAWGGTEVGIDVFA